MNGWPLIALPVNGAFLWGGVYLLRKGHPIWGYALAGWGALGFLGMVLVKGPNA